jgi:hypothetical protein
MVKRFLIIIGILIVGSTAIPIVLLSLGGFFSPAHETQSKKQNDFKGGSFFTEMDECSTTTPIPLDRCIKYSGGNSVKKSVAATNFGYFCFGNTLNIDVFNHTNKYIDKVIFTETKSRQKWAVDTWISPKSSKSLDTSSPYGHAICKNRDEINGRLNLYYSEDIPLVCSKTVKVTVKERQQIIEERETSYQTCLKNKKEEKKQTILEAQARVIFDNCMISKSKGQLERVVRSNVRGSCRAISYDPTFFEKLRWGRKTK